MNTLKICLLTCTLNFICIISYSQGARAIQGYWWNQERTSKIKIELKDGVYNGTIVYMTPETFENGAPPRDSKNPNPALRNRSIQGIQIIHNLEYNPNTRRWENGSIYDPRSGNTYSCYVWLEGDVLKIKGHLTGIRWIGRESEWYKTTP